MSAPPIRAVTFDAAGTLLLPHPSVGAVYREVLERHGCPYEAKALEAGFRRAFRSTRKPAEGVDGEERERRYWRAIVAASIEGLSPPPRDFDRLFEDLWETFAESRRWRLARGARPLLRRLRQRGYRIGLLTNWDARARRVLRGKRLLPLFDEIFISSERGREKPDPEAFRAAAAGLGTRTAGLLHVGDTWEQDVSGALEAGCQAVWLCADASAASSSACPRIARLPDLLGLLEGEAAPRQGGV